MVAGESLSQYRNGPSPDTGMSPANCLFGRSTRDLLPGILAKYRPHQDWTDRLDLRERTLSKKRVTGHARWDEHSQGLSPLRCGDAVMIQNETGRHPTKWDKSSTVVEVLLYHQYAVRTDGSGRLTTRHRRYATSGATTLTHRLQALPSTRCHTISTRHLNRTWTQTPFHQQ